MADLRSRNVMTGRFRTHYTECGANGLHWCCATAVGGALRAKPALLN